MDLFYSATLFGALLCGIVGAALALDLRVRRGRTRDRAQRAATAAGLGALLFGVLSIAVHGVYGHSPRSAEPMSALMFVVEHPTYGVVVLLAAAALRGGRRHRVSSASSAP